MSMEQGFAGTDNTYVPRPVSPTSSLREIAHLLDDSSESTISRLALSRGTTTTTDWGMLTQDELCEAVSDTDDGKVGGFECYALYDADD